MILLVHKTLTQFCRLSCDAVNFSSGVGHHSKTCVKGDTQTLQVIAGAAASCLWANYGGKDKWTSAIQDTLAGTGLVEHSSREVVQVTVLSI